ncbi:hypothetical protein D3C85_987920 [compost metagenome]
MTVFVLRNFIFLVFENKIYNAGNTINVSNVADISPPITTDANGFWTSAPALVENAIGKNPSAATDAVIITGRNLCFVP